MLWNAHLSSKPVVTLRWLRRKVPRKRGPGEFEETREAIGFFTLEQHRIIRQVLLNCVRPTSDSLFGGILRPGHGSQLK